MREERYEEMSVIMSVCRTFTDQMIRSMENCKLLCNGYRLYIEVGSDFMLNDGLKAMVKLEQPYYPDEEFIKNRMSQLNLLGEEWRVVADPQAKTGDLPPEVYYRNGERHIRKGHGEVSEKPYPVDGLWIGSDYNDPPVDGGR